MRASMLPARSSIAPSGSQHKPSTPLRDEWTQKAYPTSSLSPFSLRTVAESLLRRRTIRRTSLSNVHRNLLLQGVATTAGSAQYVSIKYTERLVQAGVEPSVGSVGDSYDNALAERINGLYKAEIIHRRGPWRSSRRWNGWTGSSRGTLLRHAGTTCHGGVTQTKSPPTNPGRFNRDLAGGPVQLESGPNSACRS